MWGNAGNAADYSGVGWADGFQHISSYGNGILLATNGLTFADQSTLGFSANANATDGGSYYRTFSSAAHQAWLDAASTNGQIWVSLLVKANTVTSTPGTSGAYGLVLSADNGFNNLVIGAAAYSANTWGYSDGSVYGSGQLSGVMRTNATVKIALCFNYNSTGTTVYGYILANDRPVALSGAFQANTLNFKPVFNGIALTSSSANSFQWDEIAVGTSYSDVTPITSNTPPAILSGPIGGAVSAVGFITFNVNAYGPSPLAYQWYHNSVPVSGATNSTLSLAGLTSADEGNYFVSVTNAFGATNSAAAQLSLLQFTPVGTNLNGAAGLIQRLLPQSANRFILETIPADGGKDTFEIESAGDKIILRGNNGVSVASALNYYLKNFCHCDASWNGDQLKLPYPLPVVSPKVHVASPHKYRFAYNYCTLGYTMAWWRWPDYEREIDCLALNGINVAHVIAGTESVFQTVLRDQFGYGDADVASWLVMPSYLPWMLMGNMYGFGGSVPQSVIDERRVLGQQICERMRELGIEPMLQGCFGMVPFDFTARYPSANVVPQGGWGGVFTEPNLLNMSDPLFPKLATNMYLIETNLYGPVRFFAADPFHEGGSTSGINLPAAGSAIQNAMFTVASNAVWVIEAWTGQPNQTMLSGTVRSQILVLDLQCEDDEQWRSTANFNGTPWLWCAIQNYGGNTGLYGKLWALAQRPVAALTDPNRGNYSGIGFVPEGSETIPAAYEMLFENAWRTNAPNLHEWVCNYAQRRYGKSLPALDQAWAVLMETVYGQIGEIQGPHNSVIEARPSLSSGILARVASTTTIPYDSAQLSSAWQLMESCANDPGLQQADSFRFDLADVTRQVLADLATRNQRMLAKAYAAGDAASVHYYGDQILEIIADLETLAATRREWLLGNWIADARSWGATPAEQDWCEFNARMLLTTWANSTSVLNDYANREWSGLIGGFYQPRWQMFMTNLYAAVDSGQAFNESAARSQIAAWELQWLTQHQAYATNVTGNTITVASNLFQKYYAQAASNFDRTNFVVGTTWSSSICSVTPVIWTRDVTSLLSGPGDYVATFQYTSGSSALGIFSASLMQNGTNVGTDAHLGWTGNATYFNNYYLTLTSTVPATTLKMVTATHGNTSSSGNITFQKCRARTLNGSWSPADCSTSPTVWTWDVSSLVTNTGDYVVTFRFGSGANSLNVDRTWLVQTNAVLDQDIHVAQISSSSTSNSYWLRVRSTPASGPILLKAAVSSIGGTNSSGTITINRVSPLPANSQTFADWSAAWGLNITSGVENIPPHYVSSYFNGSNPINGTDAVPPSIRLLQSVVNSSTNLFAIFDYTHQSDLAGVAVCVQTSTNMNDWSTADGVVNYLGKTSLPDGRERSSYSTTVPVPSESRRYFRLQVSLL